MTRSLFLDNCTLVDATDRNARPGMAVSLKGDRIESVGPASQLRPGPHHTVVDMKGAHLLPGLWDCHCHLGVYYPDPNATAYFETESERTLRALRHVNDALHAGVTALRVAGEANYLDVSLRDGFASGVLTGPRLWVAGPALKITGGHGSSRRRRPLNLHAPVAQPFQASDPWGSMEVDGVDEFRHAARQNIKMGTNWIKLMITGGVAGDRETMTELQMMPEEVKVVCDAAHAKGLKVMAHIGGPEAVKMAVKAGVDSVEHGYQMDRESVAMMAEHGVWYAPTLSVTQDQEYMRRMNWSDVARDKAIEAASAHLQAFHMAREAGVKVVNASDLHPLNTTTVGEIIQLVRAGMSAWEAITAATKSAAELNNAADRLGTIEAGKLADLIVVAQNPLTQIESLRQVKTVILGGRIIRSDSVTA
jgi:imidazolonepropionase-like amidohydrolase